MNLFLRGFRWLSSRYPFYSGCGRLANTGFLQWLSHYAKTELAWTSLRNGLSLLVPIRDFVGRAIYFFGDLDPKVTWICRRILRPGDTFLDIGANLGLVSHYAAPLVGPTGSVHAFEPQPFMADLFRRSVERNGLKQVVIHQFALGSGDGTLELSIPKGNFGAASLMNHAENGRRIEVKVVNSEEAFQACNAKSIRLIKMDVEGFEEEVLLGARSFLSNNKPDAILFESLGDKPFFERSISNLLSEMGFGFFAVQRRWTRMGVQALSRENSGAATAHEIIAVPLGVRYEQIGKLLNAF